MPSAPPTATDWFKGLTAQAETLNSRPGAVAAGVLAGPTSTVFIGSGDSLAAGVLAEHFG